MANLLERLSPNEIRSIRTKHKLSRREFAKLTRFGEASIKRWETGASLQNASADRFLRLIAENLTVLGTLRKIEKRME